MCVCRPCDVREGRTVGVKGAVDEDLAQDALPVPALAWEPCAGPSLLRFVVDYRKGGAFASKAVRFKPFSAWRRTGRESIVFSMQKALFYVSMSLGGKISCTSLRISRVPITASWPAVLSQPHLHQPSGFIGQHTHAQKPPRTRTWLVPPFAETFAHRPACVQSARLA